MMFSKHFLCHKMPDLSDKFLFETIKQTTSRCVSTRAESHRSTIKLCNDGTICLLKDRALERTHYFYDIAL